MTPAADYALVSFLPWSLFFLSRLRSPRKVWREIPDAHKSWGAYVMCWAISPILFFTLSSNVVPNYVIPAIPAFCLLTIELFIHQNSPGSPKPILQRAFVLTCAGVTGIYLSIYVTFSFTVELANTKSHKWIAERISRKKTENQPGFISGTTVITRPNFIPEVRQRFLKICQDLSPCWEISKKTISRSGKIISKKSLPTFWTTLPISAPPSKCWNRGLTPGIPSYPPWDTTISLP
jgi:hypothetical protein